jgi:hypothetical protein
VIPGSLFHDRVAAPMFKSLASENDQGLIQMLDRTAGSEEALHHDLWSYLDRRYLTPAFSDKARLKNLSGDHIVLFANGLGKLSEFLARTIQAQRPCFGSSTELLRSLFLPPERLIKKKFQTDTGVSLHVRGKYDALLFDARDQEFIVLEFKCKGDHEIIGDLDQVATYAWIIGESSGIPVRAAIFHLGEEPSVQEVSSHDLTQCFHVSTRLINEIVRWLSAKNLSDAGIPPTALPGLCDICPLSTVCDNLFGSRDVELVTQLRNRIEDTDDNVTEGQEKGILLGKALDEGQDLIYWNPFGGHPRLPNGHLLVVGTSGSGKTQVMKSLIAEIVEKRLVPLVFDFNNDYVSGGFLEKHGLRAYEPGDGLPLNPLELVPDPVTGKIQVANGIFSTAGILKRIYGLGVQQEANLRTAMEECYKDHGIFRDTAQVPPSGYPPFEHLETKIRELPNHIPLLNRLSPIFSLDLFTNSGDGQNFAEFISFPTVIRLAPLPTEEVKLAVVEFVLLQLYHHFMGQPHRISPHMAIIIDEAHKVSESDSLVTLFREIRKFGVAVILSSQKAKDFHPDIHANAASGLFLKNSEIADRKYIADQLKASSREKEEIINLLGLQRTFEALFRNDHYTPFVRLKIVPYFERINDALKSP